MGRYLEIADQALSEITEDQSLTESEPKGDPPTHCELSELSELSSDVGDDPTTETADRIDWGGSPLVQSVDERSKELRESRVDELQRVAEDDWAEVSNDPAQLVAFADSLAIVQIRESGRVPDHYNFVTNCQKCGDVPVYEGLPRAIEQCPWCMNGLTAPPILGVSE